VLGPRGPGEVVEDDVEPVELSLDDLVPAIGVGEGRDPLLAGVEGDGGPVLVGPADVDHLFSSQALPAHEDVGREVGARDVTEVERPVRVRERARDEIAHGEPRF
jgi:hypothetical protein